MVEALGEPIQVAVHHLAVAGLAKADTEVATERLTIYFVPGHANHGEFFRQQPCASQIVEGGDQQAFGEICRSPKDHQDARVSGACLRLHFTCPSRMRLWVRRARRTCFAWPTTACRRSCRSRETGSGRRALPRAHPPARLLRWLP